jgi:hypothetical protein
MSQLTVMMNQSTFRRIAVNIGVMAVVTAVGYFLWTPALFAHTALEVLYYGGAAAVAYLAGEGVNSIINKMTATVTTAKTA